MRPTILDQLRRRVARFEEVEGLLQEPAVFGDPARARALLRERGGLSRLIEPFREWERLADERRQTEALAADAGAGAEWKELARTELERLDARSNELEHHLERLLVDDDPHAARDAIMEIRGGVGGDEATLFAADLFRMYARYAERRGFRVELLSATPSEVRGYKEVIFSVGGDGAFDRLRLESGGHRVQRVPETEAQGRIHTSLATVAVLPEAEDVDVQVRDEDLRVDAFRAGGPGGQNVNKTSSAIRITHLPTGLVVSCQDESSQHKNRAKALRVLRARLFELEETRRRNERDQTRRTQIGSGDRSERVRTYNFPQNRVTDHRLKESYPLERVIEGDLDALLDDLKRLDLEQRLAQLARSGAGGTES